MVVRKKLSLLVFMIALAMLAGCGKSADSNKNTAESKQDKYPTKPISYLIPFDPGGLNDRAGRLHQPEFEKMMGTKMVFDYKPGGGGAVGWAELVKSKPDGYTIGGINLPHIVLQPLQQDCGYKTEQIIPVHIYEATPIALAVPVKSPFKTLEEFITYAKGHPGELSIGGVGTFSGHHMAYLQMQDLLGVKCEYIPFTGGAPQMMSLLGGHVSAVLGNSGDILPNKDKVRLLAFASKDRFPEWPDVPTFKEKGIDFIAGIDRGIGVPAGTPQEIIDKLDQVFMKISTDPKIQEELKKQGVLPLAMGHKESVQYVQKLQKEYSELAAKIKK